MPRKYSLEVRRQVIGLARSGTRVKQLAATFGVAEVTIYNWLQQDRVDRGEELGKTIKQQLELTAARSGRDPTTVQARAAEHLISLRDWDVALDDDTGEIADLVALVEDGDRVVIHLVHCKFSTEDTPGAARRGHV